MIKVYKLKIGEKVYEVELEAITEKEGKIITTTSTQKKADTGASASITSAITGTVVEAPMQGMIVDIVVSIGDQVAEGEELVILEAMKMENSIVAPVTGRIANIHVSKGENVDNGKVLITLA
ncbi:acetyl-CoA carboxylase biotin carboxyl carrier protein subunit [Fusobacterium necrophorum]|uniref:biotin/lipoyl-containing protein n=1 Tax=Fusobacterium necrophorum TaxID=859 RepID=UPI0025517D52|nr:biotin/lipoyl-containing protein [Fusobacterium necrophorum]MDK4521890.1 acetyl-CoA carboxylase biotin carboxyl carrier protein subunit [Fusobacterium necrophorum]